MVEPADHDLSHTAMAWAGWTRQEMARVFIAYRLFMHLGTATYMADADSVDGYWNRMWLEYDTLPRKRDLHQTRGERGIKTIRCLTDVSMDPEVIIDHLFAGGKTFTDVFLG